MDTEKKTATVEQDAAPEAPAIIQDAATVAPAQAPETATPEATEDPESYVRFHKPYLFEGNHYAGIDLKAIEDLTAKDMCEAEKYLSKKGIISPLPEMTMEYIGFIANRATGQPIEFFMQLPPKDATKVKNKVTSFFYGED
ncbi:phage tail assembly protein [uncultured Oscillibacter sp.]|jgi:hypothetical protein|uniref:phage tail assembly protein n=1 Tax=uncultured Oscillibacter sp. TaxID=876091 RepID=UPI00272B103F|nr:phage tail assembly protein [uncultured Oscillibacter sp.]